MYTPFDNVCRIYVYIAERRWRSPVFTQSSALLLLLLRGSRFRGSPNERHHACTYIIYTPARTSNPGLFTSVVRVPKDLLRARGRLLSAILQAS